MSLITPDSERSKAAFGTPLTCPHPVAGKDGAVESCGGTSWAFIEDIGRCRKRYRCKDCKRTVQYDFSAYATHPYLPLQKQSLYRRLVEAWEKKNPGFDKGNQTARAKT